MIMVIVFAVTLLIGVPNAYVLGLVGAVGLIAMGPNYFAAVAQKLFSSANSYNLMAIPMFILAGELMGLSGDVSRLMDFCRALVGLALALVIFLLSRNPKQQWVIHDWKGWRHVWNKLKAAAFSIVAPFLTFSCIAAGVATATESASLIIVLVAIVGMVIYKKIKIKDLIPMVIRSAVMSGAILITASMAGVMGWALAIEQIPTKICNFMLAMTDNGMIALLIIQI